MDYRLGGLVEVGEVLEVGGEVGEVGYCCGVEIEVEGERGGGRRVGVERCRGSHHGNTKGLD